MRTNVKRSVHLLSILSLTFMSANCDPVTCGTGTKLDEETMECVPDFVESAGFNTAATNVSNVVLKNITIDDIEIPNELTLGTESDHRITVTNGPWRQPVVTLRLHALEAEAAEIEEYLTTIGEWFPVDSSNPRCRFGGVTGECNWGLHFNGVCDDGGPGSVSSNCPLGADCFECGARNFDPNRCDPHAENCLTSCEDDSVCGTGFICNRQLEECHLRPSQIAEINIVDLAPNETRTIEYKVSFPNLQAGTQGQEATEEVQEALDDDTWLPKGAGTQKSYRLVLTAHEQLLDFAPAADNSCETNDDCYRGAQPGFCTPEKQCDPANVTFQPMARPWWVPPKFLTPLHAAFDRVLIKTDTDDNPATEPTPLTLNMRIPAQPSLEILNVNLSSFAWELDPSSSHSKPILTATVRAMFKGPPEVLVPYPGPGYGANLYIRPERMFLTAALGLPKLYYAEPTAPDTILTAAARDVELRFRRPAGDRANSLTLPGDADERAATPILEAVTSVDPDDIKFNEPFDVTFEIHLTEDELALSQVRRHLAAYSSDGSVNAAGEMAMPVKFKLTSFQEVEYNYDHYPNQATAPANRVQSMTSTQPGWKYTSQEYGLNTMFLPPPAPVWGVPPVPAIPSTSNTLEYASQYPNGVYGDVDDITPTWRWSFGGEWLGAEAQILNQSSKERDNGAVVKQALRMDNYARANFLKRQFTVLSLRGGFDWGTERLPQDNKANGEFAMASFTSCTSSLTAALAGGFGCGINVAGLAGIPWEPTDTVWTFEYAPGEDCEEEDGRTVCWIIAPDGGACSVAGVAGGEACEPELFSEVGATQTTNSSTSASGVETSTTRSVAVTANSISVSIAKEKSKLFTLGLIPFQVTGSISGSLGIKATLGLFHRGLDDGDPTTANEETFAGITASAGPFASVDLSASGMAQLGVASIGVEGSVTLISVDLLPTVELGIAQRRHEEDPCWMKNTGQVVFTGPATLEVASGSVGIAGYLGVKDLCVLGICADFSVKVFSFTLFSWDAPYTRDWNLWHHVEEFGAGDGLCPFGDIPPMDWRTPVGCTSYTGADAYCAGSGFPLRQNNALSAPYSTFKETFYAGASGCTTLYVNGSLESGSVVKGASMSSSTTPVRDVLVVNGRLDDPKTYNNVWSPYTVDHKTFNHYTAMTWDGKWTGASFATSPCGEHQTNTFQYYASPGCVGGTNGPYSGDFVNTPIRVCSRLIDVHVRSATGGAPGVSIRAQTDEGREREIFLDSKWQIAPESVASDARNPLDNNGQRSWNQFEERMNWKGWVNAYPEYLFEGGYGAAPWSVGSPPPPFTNDASKMKWLSAFRRELTVPQSVSPGRTYYRRVFVADAEAYDIHMRCDNKCDLYLDGQLVVTTQDYWQPANVTIATVPGRMHLLGVRLHTDDGQQSASSPWGGFPSFEPPGPSAFTFGAKAK